MILKNHRQRETLCDKTLMTEDINFNLKFPAVYLKTRQTSVMGSLLAKKVQVSYPFTIFPKTLHHMFGKVLNTSLASKI